MKRKECLDLWITRDKKGSDDSTLIFLHSIEPALTKDGWWKNDTGEAIVIPQIKHGTKKHIKIRLFDNITN